MTAPNGSARIRISADVDPALAEAIDRTMRRARDSVDRRMREAGDASAREAGRMGREFDAAYQRMEQAANRVNASRAREESALERVRRAQQRATDAAARNARVSQDNAERRQRAEEDYNQSLTRSRAALRDLEEAQRRAQAASTQSARIQLREYERLQRARQRHTEAEVAFGRAQQARADVERRNTVDAIQRQRDHANAINQVRAAEQARADAAAARRDAESGFDRARREVIDIDTNLNENDAVRGMTRLRARLQAMANRPIRQDVEIVARGLATVLKLAAGVLGLVTALGTLGIAAGAAIIPVAGLVASLSSMAGVLLAVPGIMAGLVTILATVVVGFTGLGEAIKQTNAAQAAAGQQAEAQARAQQQQARAVAAAQRQVESARRGVVTANRQVESATRQVTSAERTLASAHKASEQAQSALTRARADSVRTLRDLNMSVREGALDERGAVLALESARRRLNDLGSNGEVIEWWDRDEAQLAVEQAEASLDRIRTANGDLAEEQKKRIREGIEGDESVVAARDRVADATQGIADAELGLSDAHRAVADAQAGVAEAMAAVVTAQQAVTEAQQQSVEVSNAAADKAAEAMSALSANGRELVNMLVDLKPRWRELRNEVQDALLVGIGGAIQELVNNRLPLLATGMAAIASGINVGMRGALESLSNEEGGEALATLLEHTATAARNLGLFLGPATGALFNLFAIGSEYLPGLTRGLEGAGEAFLGWTRDADAVHATIERGIEVAKVWGSMLSDIGAIIGNVFNAATESGTGAGGVGVLLDQLASWSGSAEGQNALVGFFTAVRDALSAATPVLTTFLRIIGQLAPHAADIIEAFAPFVETVLTTLGDALERIAPDLPDLAAAFGTIAVEASNLVPPLAEIAQVLLPPLADVLAFIAPILPLIVAGFVGFKIATIAAAAIGAVTTAIRLLGVAWATNPLGLAITVLAALVAAAIYAYNRFDWFKDAVDAAVRAIGDVLTWMWENVWRPILGFIGEAAVWTWNNLIRPAFDGIVWAISNVATVVGWLWTNVWAPALRGIGDIASWTWNNLIRPAFDAWSAGMRFVGDMAMWLWRSVIVPVWNALGTAIRWVVDNVVIPSFNLMTGAVNAVGDAFAKAVDWIGQMWDRIKGIAAKPVKFVVETVYNNGIRAVWNKVAGWLGLAELPEVGLGSLGSYAHGGTLPGHSPGRDIYRFIDPRSGMSIDLGGGEGIVTTRTTDKLRRSGITIDQLNAWGEGRAGGSGGSGAGGMHLGGFALGGTIDRRLWELVRSRFPGLQLTSALRPGDPGHHGRGQAVDVSNGYDTTPLMQAAARYFYNAYGGQLAELIHYPLNGWQNIKNGRPLVYSAATNQQHRNHVHLAATGVLGEPGAAPAEGDGLFGSMFGFMRNAVANAAESILSPIGERIPSFGDGLMGQVPRKAFDVMQDKVVGFLRGKADAQDAESGVALGGYGGNAQFYLSEMIRAVKDLGMDKLAAIIAAATMLVETNLKMYANRSDPASLNFPYDAIGSDHDSSGLYQQRNNGAWGTIAERMNPYASSIMFLRQLRKFAYWAMDPGAAAQKVQVSAFPGKYSQRMAEARGLVDPLFDSGGLAYGRGLMMKDVIRPERVLDPATTEAFDRLVDALTLRGGGGVNVAGLSLSGDDSVTIRPAGPGDPGSAMSTGRINVNVDVTITAQTGAEAATELAATINSLITV